MNANEIFEKLWADYKTLNPEVDAIYKAFCNHGEEVVNDHIAFRTFNHSRIGIDKLSLIFIKAGYKEKGNYQFDEKKLRAKHFEHESDPFAPRVFISELIMEDFSIEFQKIINNLIDVIPEGFEYTDNLVFAKEIFQPTNYTTYETLRRESEYAAWVYAFGFRANHFTVSVNYLKKINTLQLVNQFLKQEGFTLNSSGGEIKGSPQELLEQSSTLAGIIDYQFTDGVQRIPGCYYEFALRYPDEQGNTYSGFIARSADKIFESTDYRNQK